MRFFCKSYKTSSDLVKSDTPVIITLGLLFRKQLRMILSWLPPCPWAYPDSTQPTSRRTRTRHFLVSAFLAWYRDVCYLSPSDSALVGLSSSKAWSESCSCGSSRQSLAQYFQHLVVTQTLVEFVIRREVTLITVLQHGLKACNSPLSVGSIFGRIYILVSAFMPFETTRVRFVSFFFFFKVKM